MALIEQREVRKAKEQVRAKESGAWDRVEQAGRISRQAEGAQASKQGAKAADEDGAKKRQGMTQ